MELNKLLARIKKRWLLLILLPIVSMAVTYFFVKDMPSTYTSQGTLATGLVDETQHTVSVGGITFQESQINQQFTNVIEMMKLRKVIDKISYLLCIHDFSQPEPFKKPSKLVKKMSQQEKEASIRFFKDKYNKEESLNLYNKIDVEQQKILESMKYDNVSINSALNISRKSNSDYIQIEFSSENADLSPYVVNNLCKEFIGSYDSIVQKNKRKTSDYLGELLRQKYAAMNEKIALLKNYKIENKILNLYEQSKILYSTIILVDSRKQDAQKEIESYNGAIGRINDKFNPKDRRYLEGALTSLNDDILVTKSKMQNLSDKYLKSEYDQAYKAGLDSTQKVLNRQINALTDQYIYDPLSTKKDLMAQKLSLEVQRDITTHSLNGLTRELDGFNQKFNRLVPFEAVIQSYERDIDIASREYLDILNKYNSLGMNPDEDVKLSQVQIAMPAVGAPTKKILFVLVAGIMTFVLCVLIIFVLFFFDKAISSPTELAQRTQSPVLGHVGTHTGDTLDLFTLWNGTDANNLTYAAQKALLRSIRYEVTEALGTGKVLCVTGLRADVGATFFSINLAYAFATMHKKVLLVDGNFNDSSISTLLRPSVDVKDIFTSAHFSNDGFITVVGNHQEGRSPFEIASQLQIKSVFEKLDFDIIIIDTEPLEHENKTKEWIACANKVVTVFENKQPLSDTDINRIEWLKGDGKFAGWVFNKYDTKA